ncbi:MAG: Barstar, ribonuclease (Barnase) inhibitor [Nitrospira sp.]|jgi:RNAse (barnase) inhibitor barstar|nr:MAG: Barstar, ribonuclease (Barnase) inhibitor [Nitrospira sp.]
MSITALQSIKKPWAHLLVHAEGQPLDKILSVPSHFLTKTVSGKKCKTKAGLLAEFSRVFSFPEYFGHNWDALEECLADLDWLPATGYLVVVTDADQVLTKPDEEDDFETFVEILNEAGEAWSLKESDEATGNGLPFHAVLVVSDRHKHARHNWFAPPLAMEHKGGNTSRSKGSKKSVR